jgi:hypothetical protein
MLIKIAISFIASLLVLANYKALRKPLNLLIAFILASAVMAVGIYLVLHFKGDRTWFSGTTSPFLALLLLVVTRTIYKHRNGQDIIFHMRSFYPLQHENRFVTAREKRITMLVTLLSAAIPVTVFEIFFRN